MLSLGESYKRYSKKRNEKGVSESCENNRSNAKNFIPLEKWKARMFPEGGNISKDSGVFRDNSKLSTRRKGR